MKTINCEMMLLAWDENHSRGATITLQLSDPSELEPFKAMTVKKGRGKTGIAGQRLAVVIVEIGDDEQPVEEKVKPGPLCTLAAQWCREDDFYEWLHSMYPNDCRTAVAASGPILRNQYECSAAIVRYLCEVKSRRDIDTDPNARMAFDHFIRVPYSDHLKKING